jgi:hypothetical protein
MFGQLRNMRILNQFTPPRIKDTLRRYFKRKLGLKEAKELRSEWHMELLKARIREDQKVPKFELEKKHIARLKVLLDRKELLGEMPKNSVCAEIGVNEGEFSEMIWHITQPTRLHLIDAWGDPTRYHDDLKLVVENKFIDAVNAGKVQINVGYSTKILKSFDDNYFDWVYLDTDHSYPTTAAELFILKEKVKIGGIIAGHDYTLGNWINSYRYGVIEAVHELCVKENWELIYITSESNQCRSFAIRKIV